MPDPTIRLFKVATQLTKDTDVVVRNMRCETEIELMALICRILNVTNLNNLSFFEIHEVIPGGSVVVIRDGGDWPSTAITREEPCVYAPKPLKVLPDKPVPDNPMAAVDRLLQSIRDKVDDDIGESRPSFNYTVEEF